MSWNSIESSRHLRRRSSMSVRTPVSVLMRASLSSASSSSESSSHDTSFGASSDTSCESSPTKKDRLQRRHLNKLALYLPKPLKPVAASPIRLLSTLAGSISILFLCLTILSSHFNSFSLPLAVSPLSAVVLPNPFPTHAPPYSEKVGKREAQSPLVPVVELQESPGAASDNLPETEQPQNREDTPIQQFNTKTPSKEVNECGIQGCKACGSRGCDPEGYTKGADTLASGQPKSMFRGVCSLRSCAAAYSHLYQKTYSVIISISPSAVSLILRIQGCCLSHS